MFFVMLSYAETQFLGEILPERGDGKRHWLRITAMHGSQIPLLPCCMFLAQ